MTKIVNLECIDAITKVSIETMEENKKFIDGYETGDEAIAFVTGVTGTINENMMELLDSDIYVKITESVLQSEYDELDKLARAKPLFQDILSNKIIDIINKLQPIITEAQSSQQATTIISTTFENFKPFSSFMGGIKRDQFLDFLNKKETEYVNLVKILFKIK